MTAYRGGAERVDGTGIASQLQRANGKPEYRPTTKTNRDRTLALSKWPADELKCMKAEQVAKRLEDPDGVAFLSRWGRRFDQKYVDSELDVA